MVKTGGISHYSSDTISYIKAVFTLGENWNGFDEVRAVFKSPYECRPAVLDSNGECYVPVEVLFYKGKVRVNLVGSIVTETEITDRLTTYSVEALDVDEDVPICGEESQPISPSAYEQFVAKVANDANRASQSATDAETYADEAEASAQNASESASASAVSASDSAQSAIASAQSAQNASESAISAENAKDDAEDARDKILSMRATAETLEAGSDATASYSDGLLTLGIPRGDQGIQGIQGETGATPNLTIGTVETLEPTEDATATITGTAENPVLNLGLTKGDTGEVSLEDLEALLPTDTASGEIVTITDGQAIVPAKSLKVALEPIQSGSGTPSPTNIRPISGHTEVVTHRTGINVWDEEWVVGYWGNDGVFHNDETTRIATKNLIKVLPNTTYYTNSPQQVVFISQYAEDGTFISRTAITIPTQLIVTDVNCGFIAVSFNPAYGTTYNHDISINYPSTDHDYHAYDGETYTTALGQTVYGGTLDVVSGELVVDRVIKTFDGTDTVGLENWRPLDNSSAWLYKPNVTEGLLNIQTSIQNLSDLKSDKLPTVAYSLLYGTDSIGISLVGSAAWGVGMRVNDTSLRTESAINAWLAENPITVCYKLANPQTYQLTPQEVRLLLGTNNIWSDGKVTLTYNADIQRYIEKKLNGNSTTLTMSRPMVQTEETE